MNIRSILITSIAAIVALSQAAEARPTRGGRFQSEASRAVFHPYTQPIQRPQGRSFQGSANRFQPNSGFGENGQLAQRARNPAQMNSYVTNAARQGYHHSVTQNAPAIPQLENSIRRLNGTMPEPPIHYQHVVAQNVTDGPQFGSRMQQGTGTMSNSSIQNRHFNFARNQGEVTNPGMAASSPAATDSGTVASAPTLTAGSSQPKAPKQSFAQQYLQPLLGPVATSVATGIQKFVGGLFGGSSAGGNNAGNTGGSSVNVGTDLSSGTPDIVTPDFSVGGDIGSSASDGSENVGTFSF